jgi:ABC-type transporter Mla subunit MlaD
MMTREQYQRDYRQQYKEHAKRVNLTFSLAEFRGISRSAKAAGSPLAAYVKRLALEAHDNRSSAPEELAEQLADLERVIRTIANNVNQMARHSNRIAHVLDEQEVFLHIQALQTELRTAITRAASGHGNAETSEDEGGS